MSVYEMAKHYYQDYDPPLWGRERLDKLVKKKRLTEEQVREITGEGEQEV